MNVLIAGLFLAAAPSLKVGTTLHPYYSWTANIAQGTAIEVRAVLSADVDAGNYQPRPEDIKKLADLDAIVINGVGHDDFIRAMITASGNKKIKVITPNDGVPLIRAQNGGTVNSHTFISFSNAIQQTYSIARALGAIRPELAPQLDANAAAYAKKLCAIKTKAAASLSAAKTTRVVTVHDGYSYFLQELGFEVAAVIEPAHGLIPSAGELDALVKLLKKEKLQVVLSEESFPEPLLRVIRESAGARVFVLSHVATGAYTAEKFEREMEENAATLVRALVE